ncbi:uncharacterized protein LOC62_07G009823 [Vanrija pseudolonga]|uniref:F-box domain-containing protein n=1 Tax=Vanrija pseudolonga TaxID=143232 RepID=A0AAF0YIK3_9TREE|nr:hypothetical protein LOC62_07G009823 [Vanrija pseudolonga]
MTLEQALLETTIGDTPAKSAIVAARDAADPQPVELESAAEADVAFTAAALDSDAFPHILEAVVAYAPYESLLALRATCRGLKAQVDTILAAHVALAGADDEGEVAPRGMYTVITPYGAAPSLRGARAARFAPRWDRPIALEPEHSLLRHTRVLDVQAPVAIPDEEVLALHLANVHTARLHTTIFEDRLPLDLLYLTRIPTVVQFARLDQLSDVARAWVSDLSDHVRTLILNLEFDLGAMDDDKLDASFVSDRLHLFRLPQTLGEFVLVCRVTSEGTFSNAQLRRLSVQLARAVGFEISVSLDNRNGLHGPRFTLVGLDAIGALAGHEPGHMRERVQEIVHGEVESLLGRGNHDVFTRRVLGRMSFPTLDEYEARVGAAEFGLRTRL